MAYSNLNNPANFQLQGFDQYGFRIIQAGMSGETNANEPLIGSDSYRTVLAIQDAVVNLVTLHGDTLLNKTLFQGQELHGLFQSVEVLSGEVVAYLAGPYGIPEASDIWFNFNGSTNYAVFPDNQFSFGSSFCFGTYLRTWSNEIARQVILMADSFSIEIRGKYLYVINGSEERKICVLNTGIWTYVAVNVSGTNLTVYTAVAYQASSGVITVFDNTYNFSITAPDLSAIESLRIGSDLFGNNLFYGNFAHISMWDRTLTLAEVLALRPLSISLYTASMKVDMLHHYQFSYWLEFGVLNLANDLIGSPAVNGTINGL